MNRPDWRMPPDLLLVPQLAIWGIVNATDGMRHFHSQMWNWVTNEVQDAVEPSDLEEVKFSECPVWLSILGIAA